MPRTACSFCGLPFSVRTVRDGVDYFCCSGCALASRIPVNDGQLPISAGLVVALAFGFGLFNQSLFAVFGSAVIGEGKLETGARLIVVSLVIGALLALVGSAFVLATRARRWTDAIAIVPALFAVVYTALNMTDYPVGISPWWMLAGNVWLALWLARGWARRAWTRRQFLRSAKSL